MRLFVAVDPGERLREELSTGLDARREAVRGRWVDPALMHITLLFLGECDADQSRILREVLLDTVSERRDFTVDPAGTGFFPGARRPRVFFLQMNSDGALEDLAGAIRAGVAARLPEREPETKTFRPHLTLARFRTPPSASELKSLPGLMPQGFSPFRVRDVRLVSSLLTPQGPIYTNLAVFPLAPSR